MDWEKKIEGAKKKKRKKSFFSWKALLFNPFLGVKKIPALL